MQTDLFVNYALLGPCGSPADGPEPGSDGCPTCGATCGPSGMPACRFTCPPLRGVPLMNESESSSFRGIAFSTPTKEVNQLAPCMEKWPACARLQREFGTGGCLRAHIAAWMMGLDENWLSLSATALTSEAPRTRGGSSEP